MKFENAWLTRLDGPIDVAAVEAYLASLPWAFRDPVKGKTFYLAGRIREARDAYASRLAHPTEFSPLGVLVEVQPSGVAIAQMGVSDSMARGRDFVAWLLKTGLWRVCNEFGTEWAVTSPEDLYPEPLPSPDELVDDPHGSPVLDGVVTQWNIGGRTLSVHSAGAVRLDFPDGSEIDAQLAPDRIDAWNRVADVDPDDLDFDATDPATTVMLSRETPEGEKSEWFDVARVPERAAALAQAVQALWQTLEGWSPGKPVPTGLVSIARRS